jgi:hypothetical protein
MVLLAFTETLFYLEGKGRKNKNVFLHLQHSKTFSPYQTEEKSLHPVGLEPTMSFRSCIMSAVQSTTLPRMLCFYFSKKQKKQKQTRSNLPNMSKKQRFSLLLSIPKNSVFWTKTKFIQILCFCIE